MASTMRFGFSRRVHRRTFLLWSGAAATAGALGVLAGGRQLFRSSRVSGPPESARPDARVEVLWLDYSTLDELLAASDAVVVGTIVDLVERTVSLQEPGRPALGERTEQEFTIRVSEVFKGQGIDSGQLIAVTQTTKVNLDDPRTGAKNATTIEDGSLDLRPSMEVVAFLALRTAADGSRPWGLAGHPAIAEIKAGQLAFLASPRYSQDLARRGLAPSAAGGDSPFSVSLAQVREAAPRSPNPRDIDAPRDAVAPPRIDMVDEKPVASGD
jgi:hypothetical protein